MGESDDARLERLTRLAHEVYGSREKYERLSIVRDSGGGIDVVTEAGGVLIAIGDHPHALEALEVALMVMLAKDTLDLMERMRAEADATIQRMER